MKLWMELLDSGFSRPSYKELRNAFTTLICQQTRVQSMGINKRGVSSGHKRLELPGENTKKQRDNKTKRTMTMITTTEQTGKSI